MTRPRAVAVLLALALATAATLVTSDDAEAYYINRVAAGDRYGTSVAISQHAFGPGTATTVVLASGLAFPDALAAGPLASSRNGPVLLTSPDALPPAVVEEIARLAPSEIFLVGGPNAISPEVEATLEELTTASVQRIHGANRYETAAAVAAYAFPRAQQLYLASGEHFADAVSAGGPAGQRSQPVLLTRRAALPAETAAQIARLGNPDVIVVGGEGAVSNTAMGHVRVRTSGTVRRVGGTDRYLTNSAISRDSYVQYDVGHAVLVTGTDFADALASGPYAKQMKTVVLLTRPHCVPPEALTEIYRLGLSYVTIIGGTGAVGVNVQKLVPCGPPVTPLYSFIDSASGASSGLYTRWDPCGQPIRYQIYHEPGMTISPGEISAVAQAVDRAEEATRFKFQYAGLTSDEVFAPGIDAYIGYVSGFGDPNILGEGAVWVGSDRMDIVAGYALVRRNVRADWRIDALMHEIGHLLGLGHAEDINQLMYPIVRARGQHYYGGDYEGLRLVGATMPCFPAARVATPDLDDARQIRWVDEQP